MLPSSELKRIFLSTSVQRDDFDAHFTDAVVHAIDLALDHHGVPRPLRSYAEKSMEMRAMIFPTLKAGYNRFSDDVLMGSLHRHVNRLVRLANELSAVHPRSPRVKKLALAANRLRLSNRSSASNTVEGVRRYALVVDRLDFAANRVIMRYWSRPLAWEADRIHQTLSRMFEAKYRRKPYR